MLKKLRIALASVFFIGITLLFAGIGQQWWGWMAKLQFLPSCLALNFAVIAGILLLTILCGRIYCSVICPMGVFQDLIIWIRTHAGSRKDLNKRARRFHYVKEHKIVRYAVLAAFVLAIIAGIQAFVVILAPYSAYGRIVRSILSIAHPVTGLLCVALVSLVVIAACAWMFGREYCNTICPVGTVLSLFSRFAIFRPVIDADKCKGCHSCEKKCKAGCIDSDNRKIDYSRCVDCFACTEECKFGAIKYRMAYSSAKAEGSKAEQPKADSGRRNFIATTVMVGAGAVAAKAQEMKVDGGLAEVIDKQNPERSERLVPFGAESVKDFYSRCTACQLCVSNCPNGVLRPSTDLEHFLQPQMGYDKGYCRPECNTCSQLCPAGAIRPVEPMQKLTMHIGVASVDYDKCVVNRDGVSCGNCSRHCPVGAIRMVDAENGKKIPVVMEEVCIGCGACENLCPSRPISAITVNGLSVHRNG